MSYVAPIDDIRQVVLDDALVPEQQLFAYQLPDPNADGIKQPFVVNIVQTGDAINPRWARDEYVMSFQVFGADRGQFNPCKQKIWEIFNKFVGRDTFTIGDYSYMQFNSTNAPTFVGYQENSKPLFTCSVSLVRESQVREGNRDPIC